MTQFFVDLRVKVEADSSSLAAAKVLATQLPEGLKVVGVFVLDAPATPVPSATEAVAEVEETNSGKGNKK